MQRLENDLVYIYSIAHPLTAEIVYVGQSKHPEKRLHNLSHHSGDQLDKFPYSTKRGFYCRDYIYNIEHIVDDGNYDYWEDYYMAYFRKIGYKLDNKAMRFKKMTTTTSIEDYYIEVNKKAAARQAQKIKDYKKWYERRAWIEKQAKLQQQ